MKQISADGAEPWDGSTYSGDYKPNYKPKKAWDKPGPGQGPRKQWTIHVGSWE